MINKIILTILLLISTLHSRENIEKDFPHLTNKEIAYYKKQINSLDEINSQYENFDTLTKEQKILFKDKVEKLMPYHMMPRELKNDNIHAKEFVILYAVLMNYKAYIIVDKYSNNSSDLYLASIMARLLHQLFPKNLSYQDTYLWSEVKNGRYDKALELYPDLLISTSYDEDVQVHHDYVLLNAKFNHKEFIRKVKRVINIHYYTTIKYDKESLFEELDSLQRKEQYEFIKSVNSIMKKYINNEIVLLTQKKIKETKTTTNRYLKHHIKDDTLYLKPDSLYLALYDDMKKVLENNKYALKEMPLGYKKIVLDLKDNNGGALNSLLDILSAFLPDDNRQLFIIKEQKSTVKYTTQKNKTLDTKTPIMIQINEKTSRGAMYIASILSKYKRAEVTGKYTKIDNSIQRVLPLTETKEEYILIKFQVGYSLDNDETKMKIYKK